MSNSFARAVNLYAGNHTRTADLCDRDDAVCFLQAAGVDLDIMQQQALLTYLPRGTCLTGDTEIFHPHVKWQASRDSGIYLFKPEVEAVEAAIRKGRDLVLVIPKSQYQILDKLGDYNYDMWETLGDLAMIWARDREIARGRHAPGNCFRPPAWQEFLDLTEAWAGEGSLAEKINEDGYVHHLGCIESSPYLTQLETE